ncbi:MAG: isocitrate/isopropylmalate dehydrogenase family protein [Methyloligellaceae bacterium]
MGRNTEFRIAVIPGDGIGVEVTEAAFAVAEAAVARVGGFSLRQERLDAGAAYYAETGKDVAPGVFEAAEAADAVFLGAIGLPSVRYPDGTEISPHLRMRDQFGLFAGVRPVKAYPNTRLYLADPRAAQIDLVILRESTEGLFYTHGRGEIIDDREARETLRISRETSERLFDFAFDLARRRKERGGKGKVTCVDKANVFRAYAFFRKIFDERAALNPDITADHAYVDAQALYLIRKPWEADVLVMENMFGDILSDLAGGLIGGMGMASCAEIGPEHGLFQPAHGSAPDIAGQDKANPIAAILSAGLMLDWLGARHEVSHASEAGQLIEQAVETGFADKRLDPVEFGGAQGTREVTQTLIDIVRGAQG